MGDGRDQHTVLLVNGTFVGFTIILIGLFAGYLMNTPINKRIDLFFSLMGCALFIASGALILQHWTGDNWNAKFNQIISSNDSKNMGITKGSLAIVNGILFLVDVVFTFRD
jgi:hypothetical protein